ncbi:YkvA family protein [Streptomyces sp. NPDC055036]
MWWDLLIAIGVGLAAAWLALLIALLLIRPKGSLLGEAIRLLPDLLRLLRRLATDKTLPRGVRVRLGLLMLYLAMPIDLIPDFLPIIGYADDAIIVAFVLRSVVRKAGIEAVRAHWPGTEDGFTALSRLAGLQKAGRSPRP